MPLHTGHLTLIKHGLEKCNKITILLVVTAGEPIEPELRYSWLVEHFKEEDRIHIETICRDPINALPGELRTEAWCNFIKKEYNFVDVIISSEHYGDILASFLGIDHLKFDHKREIVPISATDIRDNYKKHFHYLPEHVKKHFNL